MSKEIYITTPLTNEIIEKLNIGDRVIISGTIYTGRDAAHKKFVETIEKGEPMPFDPHGQIIYYVGPSPASPGRTIGAAGPTTSYRMDPYAPTLIKHGLKGMIGKGGRGNQVIDAMKKYKAVYFAAIGGAGALLAERIKECEIIAYPELGPEAVRKLKVEELPAIVINDCHGNDLYKNAIS